MQTLKPEISFLNESKFSILVHGAVIHIWFKSSWGSRRLLAILRALLPD